MGRRRKHKANPTTIGNGRFEAIVMDVGGVILDTRTSVTAKAIGVPESQLRAVRNASKTGGLWDDWILGNINGDQFEEGLCDITPPSCWGTIHKWLSADSYTEGMPANENVLEGMHILHDRGYQVYFLSNIVDRTLKYLRDEKIVTPFDGGVYSCEVGMMKPGHEIYRVLLERYRLNPTTTVFFDDKLDNCIAAEVVGIKAYHWKGIDTLLGPFGDLTLL